MCRARSPRGARCSECQTLSGRPDQDLIKAKADVNVRTTDGSVLHTAAASGDEGAARLLLKAKALPNVKNFDRETPLHLAAMYRNLYTDAVTALLAAKAEASGT